MASTKDGPSLFVILVDQVIPLRYYWFCELYHTNEFKYEQNAHIGLFHEKLTKSQTSIIALLGSPFKYKASLYVTPILLG